MQIIGRVWSRGSASPFLRGSQENPPILPQSHLKMTSSSEKSEKGMFLVLFVFLVFKAFILHTQMLYLAVLSVKPK